MTDRHEDPLKRTLERSASAAEAERLGAAWSALELPPPAPPPPGFAGRVAAHARSEGRRGTLGLPWRPTWARIAAAALVVSGVVLGAELGSLSPASAATETETSTPVWSADSLADSYLAAGNGTAATGADTADGNAGGSGGTS
jgi:hypothetical protein